MNTQNKAATDAGTAPREQQQNQRRFIVQTWSNTQGWQDSKYSSSDLHNAIAIARDLKYSRETWLGKTKKVRVHDSEGVILDVNLPEAAPMSRTKLQEPKAGAPAEVRECHRGAMVGEKATPEQIRLWESLGLLNRKVALRQRLTKGNLKNGAIENRRN